MSGRNWEKELAKIDKQMSSMSDDQLTARAVALPPTSGAGRDTPTASSAISGPKMPSRWGVAFRVGLAVVLAVAVPFWPYAARCGLGLGGYLGTIAVVVAAGLWAAIATWRARAARAHVLALLVIVWGASLAAVEVLPRTGYAKATAVWACP